MKVMLFRAGCMLEGKCHRRGIFWIQTSNSQYPDVNDHHQLGVVVPNALNVRVWQKLFVYSKVPKLSKGIPDVEDQYEVFTSLTYPFFQVQGLFTSLTDPFRKIQLVRFSNLTCPFSQARTLSTSFTGPAAILQKGTRFSLPA